MMMIGTQTKCNIAARRLAAVEANLQLQTLERRQLQRFCFRCFR